MTGASRVIVARDGHVLLIGLDRVEKRNAADAAMIAELADAYTRLDRDDGLRVGLVFAHGDHFTAGLDLADIGPRIGPDGVDLIPADAVDPWAVRGPACRKPIVVAVQGTCLTLGVELVLAADVAVAADSASFAQLEVSRGILPFGGATTRLPARVGWGDAMRWMLTGDRFDAAEALRIGLVQEVVPHGDHVDRALAIARSIAAQAPLAVQAVLANSRTAASEGTTAAHGLLQSELVRLAGSDDARLGMEAFLARRPAEFTGR